MKILSRDFTLREKISISILLILVLGICYYHFIDTPIKTALQNAQLEKETLETEIMIVNTKIDNLERMQAELDSILNDPSISSMPSYNNIKEELAFLNETLAMSYSYNMSVGDVNRQGDQIRRDILISFTAKDFDTMQKIIETMAQNSDRSLISNLQFQNTERGVNCSLLLTFYETMVGGTEDTGLPAQK